MTSQRESIRIAQGMAAAHGHTWGRLDLAQVQDLTQEGIHQACSRQNLITIVGQQQCMPGITSPDISPDGVISHTTGTGRFRWEVRQTSLVLTWSRPQGDYCRATVSWDVGYPCLSSIEGPEQLGYRDCIYDRHIQYVIEGVRIGIRTVEEVVTARHPEHPGSLVANDYWYEAIIDLLDPYRVDEVGDLQGVIERARDKIARLFDDALRSP